MTATLKLFMEHAASRTAEREALREIIAAAGAVRGEASHHVLSGREWEAMGTSRGEISRAAIAKVKSP